MTDPLDLSYFTQRWHDFCDMIYTSGSYAMAHLGRTVSLQMSERSDAQMIVHILRCSNEAVPFPTPTWLIPLCFDSQSASAKIQNLCDWTGRSPTRCLPAQTDFQNGRAETPSRRYIRYAHHSCIIYHKANMSTSHITLTATYTSNDYTEYQVRFAPDSAFTTMFSTEADQKIWVKEAKARWFNENCAPGQTLEMWITKRASGTSASHFVSGSKITLFQYIDK